MASAIGASRQIGKPEKRKPDKELKKAQECVKKLEKDLKWVSSPTKETDDFLMEKIEKHTKKEKGKDKVRVLEKVEEIVRDKKETTKDEIEKKKYGAIQGVVSQLKTKYDTQSFPSTTRPVVPTILPPPQGERPQPLEPALTMPQRSQSSASIKQGSSGSVSSRVLGLRSQSGAARADSASHSMLSVPSIVSDESSQGSSESLTLIDSLMQENKYGQESTEITAENRQRERELAAEIEKMAEIHKQISEAWKIFLGTEKKIAEPRGIDRNIYGATSETSKKPEMYQVARNEVNRDKNRYPNRLAGENSRVCLRGKAAPFNYINASYIGKPRGSYCIVSQAPTKSSMNDHWQMIWENDVPYVEVLSRDQESSPQTHKKESKVDPYWPKKIGGRQRYGDYYVKCIGFKKVDGGEIATVEVKDSKSDTVKKVVIGQFKEWPESENLSDRGMRRLRNFEQELKRVYESIQEQQVLEEGEMGWPLIHCNDGMGRSGVVVLANHTVQWMKTLPQSEVDEGINVNRVLEASLKCCRKQRSNQFIRSQGQVRDAMKLTVLQLEDELHEKQMELSRLKQSGNNEPA